ncbi:flocculation protein FLO11 isoform X1 [Bradysia coprophila]|uniref:flocculation protein FLO11 isoform X1 n=1 Tax=Bradysia coprophila TaxID=38358 RepID=UPI00187DD87F|nr:flocculation protein FLO11 isoform X1 [Bradysia coprophila]
MGYTHLLICLLLIGVEGITTNTRSAAVPSDHLIPPPINQSVQRYGQSNEEPTFFQRIASWFGYGGEHTYSEIKSNASPIMPNGQSEGKQNMIQERYIDLSAPAPPQSIQDPAQQKPKSGCNPCNKVPWMPVFGGQPVSTKGNSQKHLQPQYNQQPQNHHLHFQQPPSFHPTSSFKHPNTFQRPPHGQRVALPTYTPPLFYSTPRAVPANSITSPEYQPPHHLLPIQQTQNHLVPIPLPNLSATLIPPLYDIKPFATRPLSNNGLLSYGVPIPVVDNLPVQTNAYPVPIIHGPIYFEQQVPQGQNEALHFRSAVTPTSDIEIVKSVPLGEFTSSIEYPPSIIQSPIIDLTDNTQISGKNKISQSEYLSEPIVVDSSHEREAADSLSSASSKNFTLENEPNRETIKSDGVQFTPAKIQQTTTLGPKPFKSGDSHGRTKTNVEIEASVQTSNEQAKPVVKKERETPKDLLDSPIFYLKKTSLSPITNSLSEVTKIPEVATTKPLFDYSPWSPSTHQGIYTTLAYAPSSTPVTSAPPTNVPVESSVTNTEMVPATVDKKPKQIQIIIPYTNKNQPRPFRANKFQNFEASSGWSHQTHSNDYQDSQESQVVTATVTQAPMKKTTKYLTKILASSLRDLLKKEKSNYTSIDLSKLQKNIDGWTEQEFSMVPNKASTISFRGLSKNIPTEYLTTTTPIQPFTTTTDMIPTTSVEQLYADEEYKKADYFGKAIDENQLNFDGEKHVTTILPMPFKANKISETHELWNKLNVAISPVTKEKVYVVTPQPWKEYTQDESDLFGTFKSPRFSVRPTPGVATTSSSEQKLTLPESDTVNSLQNDDNKKTGKFTPSWIVSSFKPSPQVETIDGHSRVLTVVTPPAYDWKIVA